MCHGQKLVIPAIWIDVSIGNLDSHDMMGNHTTFIPYNLTIAQTHMYICIIYIYTQIHQFFLWSQTFWLISYITLSRDKVAAFTLPSSYILPNYWCLNPTSSWIIQSVVKSNVTIHVFRVFVYIYIYIHVYTLCVCYTSISGSSIHVKPRSSMTSLRIVEKSGAQPTRLAQATEEGLAWGGHSGGSLNHGGTPNPAQCFFLMRKS